MKSKLNHIRPQLTNDSYFLGAKYCPLLLMNDGLRYLKDLLSGPDLPEHVAKLALLTLFQIER